MFHTIYQTRNLINNKIYIGYHATKQINDSYLGSGKYLKKAIIKHGKENFDKIILYVFPTKKEALIKEFEIVNEEFILRKDTYNFKVGGEGGWDHIFKKLKEDPAFKKRMYQKHSQKMKELHENGTLLGWTPMNKTNNKFKGKKHSSESKKRISQNNGNKLKNQIFKKRLSDIEFEKERSHGWINRLSIKWGVSHTQVRRFVNAYVDNKRK